MSLFLSHYIEITESATENSDCEKRLGVTKDSKLSFFLSFFSTVFHSNKSAKNLDEDLRRIKN